MTPRAASLALLVLLSVPAHAAIPPIVTEALKAMENEDDSWAYTRTTVEKDGKQIDRYDPSRPAAERWTLVEKNGKAPTAREQTAFRKERAKLDDSREEKKSKKDGPTDPAADLIREGSLRLVREDANQVVYSFLLPADDDMSRKMGDAIKGTLTIGKSNPHALAIEMVNDKPIKPMTSVNIDRFRMRMEFRPIGPEGPVLPYRIEALVHGRALFVKSLDQDTVTTYSDYRKAK